MTICPKLNSTGDSISGPSSQLTQNKARHPPHLKGREIGLFYARQHSQRNKDDQIVSIYSNFKFVLI